MGCGALSNSHGSGNTALGRYAGYNGNLNDNFTGNDNIYIGASVSPGSFTESGTIRIGGSNQSQTFIAGIATTNIVGTYVTINGQGQLGISTSSRRYKEDIQDMGEASRGLMQLRPVTFHYKPEYAGGPRTLQYGLIAEEVAAVYPDLVFYDPQTGLPQTVAYHLVNAMLLNEVQKQHRHILAQDNRINTLADQNEALAEQNKGLAAELAALKQQNQELAALKAQVQELSALKEQFRTLAAQVAPARQAAPCLAGLEAQSGR